MRNSDDSDQYDMYDHEERVTMPKKMAEKTDSKSGIQAIKTESKEKGNKDEEKLAAVPKLESKKLSQNKQVSKND